MAQAQQTEFDIPAQPLSSALSEFGLQSELQISGASKLTGSVDTSGVSGSMSNEAALKKLLAGSDLSYRFVDDDTVVIEKPRTSRTDVIQIDEIVLTGELIDRSLQDSRTSVAVLDGESLELGISPNFSEILERTPGITNTGGGISIRGIGESPNGVSGEKTINVQVDGATFGVQSRLNSTNFSTWDLEQLEILRGPQSTQTGRNALAGAIVVRSRDPQYFQEARVKLGYASFDTAQAAIALNTPLVDDTVAVRFSYDTTVTDGEISTPNPAVNDIDAEENTTTRLGLRWDPTDQLSAVLKFSRLEIERPFLAVETAFFPDFVSNANDQSDEESTLDTVNLRATYDFDNAWSLISSTAFSDFETSGQFDLDGTAAPGGVAGVENETDWFEQEIAVNYVTDKTSAVLGAFYYNENAGNIFSARAIGIELSVDEELENYALFSEIEYAINDQWSVIAGFRYDVEEGTVNEVDTIGAFELIKSSDFDFSAFLPKGGVVYSFDENTSLGFVFQQGYRAGGVGFNRLGGSSEFDPEYTDNYELSFRSEFLDGKLTINSNIFYTDWTDRQVRVLNPPFTIPDDNRIANIGSSERYGFELDFSARPTENLSLYGGIAYVEDEAVTPRPDLGSNVISNSRERTAVLGGSYTFFENWYCSGSVNYTDPTNKTIDSRTLVDLQVGYRQELWNAYVFTTNLFDELYTLNGGGAVATRGNSRRVGVVFEATF
ncbi:MAG: TonB-dependent receptor [Pseudomonadota bacterium]